MSWGSGCSMQGPSFPDVTDQSGVGGAGAGESDPSPWPGTVLFPGPFLEAGSRALWESTWSPGPQEVLVQWSRTQCRVLIHKHCENVPED